MSFNITPKEMITEFYKRDPDGNIDRIYADLLKSALGIKQAESKLKVAQSNLDQAKKAHNCQANARHRIERGDARLKVRNGRSWDHYCVACAKTILECDIAELQGLTGRLTQNMPVKSS